MLRLRGGDFLKRAGTVVFAVAVILWALLTFPQLDPIAGASPEEQAAALLFRNSDAASYISGLAMPPSWTQCL